MSLTNFYVVLLAMICSSSGDEETTTETILNIDLNPADWNIKSAFNFSSSGQNQTVGEKFKDAAESLNFFNG